MSIKVKKCTFAATRLEYLGHELTPEGVRPLQRLVDAVVEFATPTDTTGVKRFVHLAGYYRRFIENFGQKMAPLTHLLRKERAWEWGDEQQHAFESIKLELSQKPLLAYPNFELPFVLATDASLVGLGAVLQQDHGNGLQPLAYSSKVNTPTQAKYTITELECLAVVWAIEHFRPFLYGRKFTVEYEFDVVYRRGRDNVVPDALSRAPVNVVTARARAHEDETGRQLDEETIMQRQQESEMCRVAAERGQIAGLRVEKQNGKLVVHTELGWRTLLPPPLWAPALRECHDSIWAGHLRGPQTLARVQRAFWWPRIHQVTLDWVASCRDCGSRKVRPAKVVPPLRSLQVGEVCDRWALDFAGPLPVTAGGNRYVLAVVEYATKWVVAIPAPTREATTVARALLEKVVFQFGPFRELLTDGAAELQSETVRQLVILLQAKQTTPVAYRPNLMGLVERYNRVWKDMVSIYVNEHQDDWDEWLPALAYAYNSAKHTATGTPWTHLDEVATDAVREIEREEQLPPRGELGPTVSETPRVAELWTVERDGERTQGNGSRATAGSSSVAVDTGENESVAVDTEENESVTPRTPPVTAHGSPGRDSEDEEETMSKTLQFQ
ncbi:hypothetical protein P43SY_010942 [Pythium insidiosum]|uniref:Integrase catalytic domain-containing protein n=1 Tax=Pythium insidiosum TaxID=114742 RepID=A0AAD5L940_PYTIN|nr:hypothetical protein P43SY_010942 [Pythium insidiosum]